MTTRASAALLRCMAVCAMVALPSSGRALQDSIKSLTSNTIFDVRIVGNTIWVATAKGMNRTFDNGDTWQGFTRAVDLVLEAARVCVRRLPGTHPVRA